MLKIFNTKNRFNLNKKYIHFITLFQKIKKQFITICILFNIIMVMVVKL